MKILLIGIYGVYNYGCEAIVRGTVNMMRRMFPGIEIDYASSRVKDDKRRLKGCDVKIISRKNELTWWGILRRVLNKFHIKNNIWYENLTQVSKYDAVFSIGGDMYTLSSDGNLYNKGLVQLGNYCVLHGIPYVLWGCSVGPFEKNQKIKEIFISHLSKIPLIVAREPVTINYLSGLGISDNVCFSFDPAFYVRENNPFKQINEIKRIGINLSPLSIAYLKLNREKCVETFSDTINYMVGKFHVSIYLLPHVVTHNKSDDDLSFLKEIYDKIEYKNNVELISSDPGFEGIKKYITQCDLIFAARMHCAINAITCGVPVYFLSYSEKSKGMAKLVYGDSDYCIKLTEFRENNIETLLSKAHGMRFKYCKNDLTKLKAKIESIL